LINKTRLKFRTMFPLKKNTLLFAKSCSSDGESKTVCYKLTRLWSTRLYPKVSRTGYLERELQMVQLSATSSLGSTALNQALASSTVFFHLSLSNSNPTGRRWKFNLAEYLEASQHFSFLQGRVLSPTPNPHPGGPGLCIYISQREGGPVIPPSHRVPILVASYDTHGLRWDYSYSPVTTRGTLLLGAVISLFCESV
jgi:hypothetical protein